MGDKSRQLTQENSKFSFAVKTQFSQDGQDKGAKRKFSGTAYSGEVIPRHWFWGDVVFDLTTMSVPEKLPILIDHDRGQRAGFVTSHSVSNTDGFSIAGNLLSNASGQAVASDSDEGFPWQMSVHIEPGSIEEVAQGTPIVVNGRSLVGPLTVFRNSSISEVSFTATGWDSKTSAVAMSRSGGQSQPSANSGEHDMTKEEIEALQAESKQLKDANATLTKERDAARDELAKFSKERRSNDIKQLFSDIKKEYKDDDTDVQAFSNMDQTSFDAMAKVLRGQFSMVGQNQTQGQGVPGQNALQHLFQHQAAGGAPAATTAVNPLLADAQKRADQFSKQR